MNAFTQLIQNIQKVWKKKNKIPSASSPLPGEQSTRNILRWQIWREIGRTRTDGGHCKRVKSSGIEISQTSCQQTATKSIYKTEVCSLPSYPFSSLVCVTNKPSEMKIQYVLFLQQEGILSHCQGAWFYEFYWSSLLVLKITSKYILKKTPTKQAAKLKLPIKECKRTCMYVCTTIQFYV